MDDAARDVIESAASQTAELGTRLAGLVGAPDMTSWEDIVLRANARRLIDAGRSLGKMVGLAS